MDTNGASNLAILIGAIPLRTVIPIDEKSRPLAVFLLKSNAVVMPVIDIINPAFGDNLLAACDAAIANHLTDPEQIMDCQAQPTRHPRRPKGIKADIALISCPARHQNMA